MTGAERGAGPLDGVRVVDFSRVLSGPSCGKALVDLGADVVKVEPPDGDVTRTAQPRVGGVPAYFAQQNCGKRCVSIDLRTDRGRALALDLMAASDVVVENFRPGVMARLGLGHEAVRARRPDVVYCSISGYGQDGPAAGRRAYAQVVHAEVGVLEFSARKLGAEIRPEAVSHADIYSGLQAALAITAALYQRRATGAGQHLDVAMAEVVLQSSEWTAVELAGGEGDRPHVFGGFNAPVLRLGDGTVVCVPGDPVASFPRWCQVLARPELLDDERFATAEARRANRGALLAELQAHASGVPSFDEYEAALGTVRMAVGAVRSLTEAASEPWVEARGALVDVGAPGAPLRLPRSPFRFSDADVGTRGRPASQGEHNAEVLGERLGIDAATVAALEAEGVLVRRPAEEVGG